jgi:broad specificity phosphatase PhoE
MHILFCRHGESEANVARVISNRDLPHHLTAEGRRQAARLAAWLCAWTPQRVLTSPVPRAVETAEIISGQLGLPCEIAPALREYDCGVLEGRGDEEAWALHRALPEEWRAGRHDRRLPGGESLNDVRARFVPFVEGLVARHRGLPGGLVLVGHGGLYRWMLPEVLRGVDAAAFEAHGLGYAGCWVAELTDGGLECVAWRDEA